MYAPGLAEILAMHSSMNYGCTEYSICILLEPYSEKIDCSYSHEYE